MREILDVVSKLVVVLTFPIGLFQYIRSQRRHRTDLVMRMLAIIGTDEQRHCRKLLYAAAKAGKSRDELSDEEIKAFEKVSVTLDRIGMYAIHDKDFQKIALQNHYDIFIRCWNASRGWIDDHVKDYGRKHFHFYRTLVEKAIEKYPGAKDITAV